MAKRKRRSPTAPSTPQRRPLPAVSMSLSRRRSHRTAARSPQLRPRSASDLEMTVIAYTTEPLPHPSFHTLPPKVQKRMEQLNGLCKVDPARALPELRTLYAQFPSALVVANTLSSCLVQLGFKQEGRDLAEKIAAEHPDYLFGRITLAQMCLNDFDLPSARRALQPGKSLAALCPDRTLFHLSEILAYHYTLGKYHLLHGDLANGEASLSVLEHFDPDDRMTHDLRKLFNYCANAGTGTFAAFDAFLEELETLAQDSDRRLSRKTGSRFA